MAVALREGQLRLPPGRIDRARSSHRGDLPARRRSGRLHERPESAQHRVELRPAELGADAPLHHHDAEIGIEHSRKQAVKHWKTKAWKRRKVVRKQRVLEIEHLRDIA